MALPLQKRILTAGQVRCPIPETAEKMEQIILEKKKNQDSIGGCVTCVIRNCPPGLGEPCFDKFEALLGKSSIHSSSSTLKHSQPFN